MLSARAAAENDPASTTRTKACIAASRSMLIPSRNGDYRHTASAASLALRSPYQSRATSPAAIRQRAVVLRQARYRPPHRKRRNTSMPKLEGKVAVVTGGSSGIGFATAKRFVEEGAFVYITGRRQTELDKAVSEIGRSVTAIQGDVSNLADLDRLYAKVGEGKGKFDILFAGAGIVDPQPLAETTEERFDRVFAINTRGLAFTVKKALPLLKDGGAIIVITSIAESKGIPGFTAYSATKAAVRSFVRTWTKERTAASASMRSAPARSTRRSSSSRRRPRKGPTRPAPSSPQPSRSAGSAVRTRSHRPPCSSLPTKQASSQAWTSRSMAA